MKDERYFAVTVWVAVVLTAAFLTGVLIGTAIIKFLVWGGL